MHPSDEELIEYMDGRRVGTTRRHLDEGCPECSRRLESIQQLMTTMRTDRDADPPAAWVARAVSLRAKETPHRAGSRVLAWIGGLAEELAGVISDSFSGSGDLAIAGVRSAGSVRRLRFETASVELDLQIEPELDAAVVTGQFAETVPVPTPIGNAPFLVVIGDGEPIEGTTDRLGEFSIEAPRGADLQLRLRHDDRVMRFDVPPEPTTRS